jgi:glycosyltransferase involved in cell wall biosynthesis
MKILIVTPYFYPKIGGAENYALNISRGLVNDYGHEVVIITSGEKGGSIKKQKLDGMTIYRLPYQIKFSNTPFSFKWRNQIRSIIENEKPHVINAYTPVPLIADIAIHVAGRTPTVLTCHAATLRKNGSPIFNIVVRIYEVIQRKTLRNSSLIITVSEYVRDCLPKKFQDKASVIYNAIDPGVIPRSNVIRKSNQLIFVAILERSHAWKGLHEILQAVAILKDTDPTIRLLVLGDGDMRKMYEAQAKLLGVKSSVNFLGSVTGREKYLLIKSSALMIVYPTTENDAFPTVFLEAWACGIPVVAADIGALSTLIKNGKNGQLVQSRNPEMLAWSIRKLLLEPELIVKLGSYGKSQVKSKFNWEASIKATNDIYMDLIKSTNIINGNHNNKRIDYFNSFPLVLYEAESIHVYEVCKNFQKLNCDVRLFTPKSNVASESNFQQVDVKCPRMYRSIFFQLLLVPKVIKLWHNNKPDFIYIRVSILLIMPTILSIIYKIPLIVEINGTIVEETTDVNYKLMNIFIKLGILRFIEQKIYNRSSKIITVTPGLKEYLINKFKINGDKIYVVENGVDADLFKPNSKASDKVIGYVGELRDWQGLSYVIEALPLIVHKIPEARLVIVGDGPDKSNLEKIVKRLHLEKYVEFIGAVEHDLIPNYINSFDICVAYYTKVRSGITSPFKIYEYLSCGKSLIVSNIKGVGDKFNKVAKVTEAENSAMFAEAVINLFNDRAEQDRLSKAGREFILDGHSWYDVAEKTLNIIQLQK